MSRATLEAYYRLNCKSTVTKTPTADQLKEKSIRLNRSTRDALQQSRDELESLQKECAISTARVAQHDNAIDEMRRKETQDALQQPWVELESLQKECAVSTARIPKHDNAIDEMRRKEKAWQGCCLIAEEKLREILEKVNSLQCHINPSSPQRKQSVEDRNDEAKLQKISEQRGSLRYNKILLFPKSGRSLASTSGRSLACQNVDQNELKLALKIYSRDEGISSLEQVLDENIKSTQDLQAELQSLVVTHRMREKEMYDSHAQKEEDFKYQIESLRKELLKAEIK